MLNPQPGSPKGSSRSHPSQPTTRRRRLENRLEYAREELRRLQERVTAIEAELAAMDRHE